MPTSLLTEGGCFCWECNVSFRQSQNIRDAGDGKLWTCWERENLGLPSHYTETDRLVPEAIMDREGPAYLLKTSKKGGFK